ncbi:MAG: hypothetical protein WCH93_05930 [Actinomycetota bacterium]
MPICRVLQVAPSAVRSAMVRPVSACSAIVVIAGPLVYAEVKVPSSVPSAFERGARCCRRSSGGQ